MGKDRHSFHSSTNIWRQSSGTQQRKRPAARGLVDRGGLRIDPAKAIQQDICTKKVPTDPKELSLPLISVSLAEISRFSSVEDVP